MTAFHTSCSFCASANCCREKFSTGGGLAVTVPVSGESIGSCVRETRDIIDCGTKFLNRKSPPSKAARQVFVLEKMSYWSVVRESSCWVSVYQVAEVFESPRYSEGLPVGNAIVTFCAVQIPTCVRYSAKFTAIIWLHKDSTKSRQRRVCVKSKWFLIIRKLQHRSGGQRTAQVIEILLLRGVPVERGPLF